MHAVNSSQFLKMATQSFTFTLNSCIQHCTYKDIKIYLSYIYMGIPCSMTFTPCNFPCSNDRWLAILISEIKVHIAELKLGITFTQRLMEILWDLRCWLFQSRTNTKHPQYLVGIFYLLCKSMSRVNNFVEKLLHEGIC